MEITYETVLILVVLAPKIEMVVSVDWFWSKHTYKIKESFEIKNSNI